MIPKSLQDQRKGIIGLFIWLLIFFTVFLVRAATRDEWDAVAALAGATIAIIPAILAYETIFQSRLDRLPAIDCIIDSNSRYSFFQLGIKNTGGSTAYNIRLRWLEKDPETEKPIEIPLNCFGKPISFDTDEKNNYISSLIKGEIHLTIVDGYMQLFDRYREGTRFVALITYNDRFNKGNNYEVTIPISFDSHRTTLNYTNEQTKALYDIQEIQKSIKKIENYISDINRTKV